MSGGHWGIKSVVCSPVTIGERIAWATSDWREARDRARKQPTDRALAAAAESRLSELRQLLRARAAVERARLANRSKRRVKARTRRTA